MKKTTLNKPNGYSGIYNTHKYWGKKPSELYEIIINTFAKKNSIICDPFVGSGVLPSICKKNGINFSGCDLNPVAVDIANIFVNPPKKEIVEKILITLKKNCQDKINESYKIDKERIISHIIWENNKPKQVWIKNNSTKQFLKLNNNLREKIYFKRKILIQNFRDRKLQKNSRINVESGQKVSDLFTARALNNIDILIGEINKLPLEQKKIAKFILSSSLGQMSKMVFAIEKRKNKKHFKEYEVGSWVIGYWRPKTYFEINVWNVYEGRTKRLIGASNKESLAKHKKTKCKINITCDDAEEYLTKIKSKTFDLIITDPPHSDRIPYLELSEMWNTFLNYSPKLDKEFIYSNSITRKKTLNTYLNKFEIIFKEILRVLKNNGIFILIFNTKEQLVWDFIKKLIDNNKVNYLGKFSADYSANSVVQDNRRGALLNDWCLVISKGKFSNNKILETLPSWTKQWISNTSKHYTSKKNLMN
jgi:DNA modification methylase